MKFCHGFLLGFAVNSLFSWILYICCYRLSMSIILVFFNAFATNPFLLCICRLKSFFCRCVCLYHHEGVWRYLELLIAQHLCRMWWWQCCGGVELKLECVILFYVVYCPSVSSSSFFSLVWVLLSILTLIQGHCKIHNVVFGAGKGIS